MRATLGLFPVRLLLVAGSVVGVGLAGSAAVDPLAFALAFFGSRTVLHVLEALTLGSLSDAARAARRPAPGV